MIYVLLFSKLLSIINRYLLLYVFFEYTNFTHVKKNEIEICKIICMAYKYLYRQIINWVLVFGDNCLICVWWSI